MTLTLRLLRISLCWLALAGGLWVGAKALSGKDGFQNRVRQELMGAHPLVGRATQEGVTLTVEGGERPSRVTLELTPCDTGQATQLHFSATRSRDARTLEADAWPESLAGSGPSVWLPPETLMEIVIHGLSASSSFFWSLTLEEAEPGPRRGAAVHRVQESGRFTTVRDPGQSFHFALVSDMHFFLDSLRPSLPLDMLESEGMLLYGLDSLEWFRSSRDTIRHEFSLVAANVCRDEPDFVIGLGDHFDLHTLGFNPAFSNMALAEQAHRETRDLLAEHLADAGALYQVLGNWEGESGDHDPEQRAFARQARQRYQVNPRPGTPGCAGSEHEDYYRFSWGDGLFVVLNVRGYTSTSHLLGGEPTNPGGPTDFTLGDAQFEFLEESLRLSDPRYKFLCIHHVVGGNGGDRANSSYGRGGGRAASVGEQARIHELMKQHGVQALFYGHDHVFTDIVVDGIHYALPGTTSAPWRFDEQDTGYETFWKTSGHGRVEVTPELATVEFVNIRGEVLHQFTLDPSH